MHMLVNTAVSCESLIPAVRRTIQELDSQVPVADIHSVDNTFRVFLFPFRAFAVVMATCGVLALVLASIGIYGVVSYAVAQRTKEVGIRIALGALQKDILKLLVVQGMSMVLYGLGIGLVLALVLTRVMASLVFDFELLLGVSATDLLTFVGVTLLLVTVSLLACYWPARRATKVDPLEALRYE